jgi:hypothetical protein
MGAEPYRYFVPYEQDTQSALNKLRQQVFASGKYNGAEFSPSTPEEAFEMAGEDGTGSILDISRIASTPDFCCAAPFSNEELQRIFGTDKPTAEEIERSYGFWEGIERGQARYVIVYVGSEPKQICFAGYAFD